MLAAFKLRAVPINVNYRYVEDELRYLLDDADARAVVFHREFAPKLAAIRDAPELTPSSLSTTAPSRRPRSARRLRSRARGREHRTRLRTPLGRRSLHPLHRRHHRHAQGRDVAPRGHLLRRDGRRVAAAVRRSPRPRRSPSAAATARTRCVPACPFMHGTAHWMAFSALFTGGTVVIPAEHHFDALELWQLDRARAGQLHRDRRRRVRPAAARRARHRRRPRARRVGLARVALRRRDPLAVAEARRSSSGCRRVLVVDGYGASETGGQGQSVAVVGRRRFRARRASASTTTPRARRRPAPAPARRRRPARAPRPDPARLLQGPREDRGDLSRRRRRALGGARRSRGRRRRRHRSRCSAAARCRSTPAARRCIPKRSKSVLKGARRACSTRSWSACPTSAGANASSRSCSRAPDAAADARAASQAHAREHLAGYKVPRDIVLVDAIDTLAVGQARLPLGARRPPRAAGYGRARMTNRLGARDQPVPPPARRQSRSTGTRGATRRSRMRARRRQADLPVGRLLVVPLVPRDGARVVRGPGDRRR